jgi:hypothetical protein
MASVVTPAVRIYRKVKSKDTVLPTRAAVLLGTDGYAFYFLLLYRMFQLESRPNREHCVLYFSMKSEALNLSDRLQYEVTLLRKLNQKVAGIGKNLDRMQSSANKINYTG